MQADNDLKEKVRAGFFCRCITPLVEIDPGIYAKVEGSQKTGSVKDRFVLYAVRMGVLTGAITSKSTLVEATSGNTGVSLAAAGAFLGLPVKIIMPSNMSKERRELMENYGAEIIDVGPSDFAAAIELRNLMVSKTSNEEKFWSPMQFESKLNVKVHEEETGPEISDQICALFGRSTWDFVSGAGTGGTLMGIAKFFQNNKRSGNIVQTVPAESSEMHGIQGIGDGRDFLLNPDRVFRRISVSTKDAIDAAKKFSKTHGLFVGISSGANIVASREYARSTSNPVVTLLPDRGERYVSIFSKQ